jgi:hypothetical protein
LTIILKLLDLVKARELKQSDLHPSLYSARAMAAKNLRDDKYILSKKNRRYSSMDWRTKTQQLSCHE